jgi:hypothetical protein
MMSINSESQSSFKVGSQTAEYINIAGRDQHIEGGQRGKLTSLGDARLAAEKLRQAFASTQSRDDTPARELVDAIVAEMRRPTPNRRTVDDRVRKLIELINASASVASLAAAVTGPLHILMGWLAGLA